MEEIKVGDFIRTDNGICKVIENVDEYVRDDQVSVDYIGSMYHQVIWKKRILKHSKNIIDLIQCGDYVNGGKVVEIDASKDWIDNSEEDTVLRQEDIKSIVTKEQFSSVEYRLQEGDK